MFWLAPYDAAGDQYFIDDVVLEKTGGVVVPPPASLLSNPGLRPVPLHGYFTQTAVVRFSMTRRETEPPGQVTS